MRRRKPTIEKSSQGPDPLSADRPFVLDRTCAAVLAVLAPYAVALTAADMERLVRISRKTMAPALRRLLDRQLVAIPFGDRSGFVITDAGRDRLDQLPPAFLSVWRIPAVSTSH